MKPPIYKFIPDDSVVRWIDKKFYKDTNIFAPEEDSKTSNYRAYSYSHENVGTSVALPSESYNKSRVASLYNSLGLGIKRKRGRPRKNFNPFLDFNYTLEKQSRPQESKLLNFNQFLSIEKDSNKEQEDLFEGLDEELENEESIGGKEEGEPAEDDLDMGEEEEERGYENQAIGDDADLVSLRLRRDAHKNRPNIASSSTQEERASVDQLEDDTLCKVVKSEADYATPHVMNTTTHDRTLEATSLECNVSLVDINVDKKKEIGKSKQSVPINCNLLHSPKVKIKLEKLTFSDINNLRNAS